MRHSHTFRVYWGDRGQGISYHMRHSHTFRVYRGDRGQGTGVRGDRGQGLGGCFSFGIQTSGEYIYLLCLAVSRLKGV